MTISEIKHRKAFSIFILKNKYVQLIISKKKQMCNKDYTEHCLFSPKYGIKSHFSCVSTCYRPQEKDKYLWYKLVVYRIYLR